MSIKKKTERHSFVDGSGQRWLQCKYCYDYQEVEGGVVATTCGNCVVKLDLIKFPDTAIKRQKTGKEQPKLKGTLEPTKVKPRKKKKKLTEDEKLKRDLKNWNKRKKLRRGK